MTLHYHLNASELVSQRVDAIGYSLLPPAKMNLRRRFGTRTTKENILANDSVTTQSEGLGTNMKNKVTLSQTHTPQSSQSVKNEPVDEIIFRSPLITILASLDYSRPESQRISCHDLIDAYSAIILGLKANIIDDSNLDPKSLGLPTKLQASEFVCAVRRDTKGVLYGPSLDEQSALVSENEVHSAWSIATLSHHALRLVSVVFAFPRLHSLFTVKHLTSLLDDVLTILLTQSLPTPNASRTHGLLLWILQVQKLNTSIITARQEKILQVTDHALRDVYQGNHSAIDGLKIMAGFLHKSQREIQHRFWHHFDRILPFLASASPAQRFHATSVLSAFAYAKINKNIEPEHCFFLRDRLHSFLSVQSGTASPEPRLTDFLEQALLPGRPRFEGAQWAVVTIASIIVLLDGSIFNSGWAATTIKMLGLIQKISTIDAMIPLIWNCLIWSFSRLPSNQTSRYDVFDVLRQEVGRGNGNALVATLLRCMPLSDTPDPDCVLSKALLVVDVMAGHEDTDTRRHGLELLYKLSSGGDSADPSVGEDLIFLLNPILFDGTVLNTKSGLEAVVRKIKPVKATLARCLTEMEVQQHWGSLLGIWSKSLLGVLEAPEPDIQGIFFDIWQFLLLVPTQLTPQQCHLTASTAFVNEASDMILRFINHELVSRAEKHQLFVVQRLWDTLHHVFTPQSLIQPSQSLLKAVIGRNFSIEDGATLSQWIILCHALSSNRSAEHQIEFGESWVIIAQIMLQNNYSPDRLIPFLRLPLTLSFTNEDYVQLFGDLLRSISVELRRAFQEIATSVTAFWAYLWPESCYSPSSYPHLVHCIFQSIDKYIAPISVEDRQLLNAILSELHPAHISADPCIVGLPLKYVALVGRLVSVTPDEHLLTILSFLSDFLTTWIQDKSRLVADDEYNRIIAPVYCTIVQRLSNFEASTTILKGLDSLLISPLERCPHPGQATQAFIKFWRETYHHRTLEFYSHYSADLREALKCLDIVFHVGFTEAFSLSTDSQIEDESFIIPESIPTSSPQRPSTTARPPLPVIPSWSASHRDNQCIDISGVNVNAEIATDSRNRKPEEEATTNKSQTSGQTTSSRKRKAMVMECVQLPQRNRAVIQRTKQSRESQLMTPEPSRCSSESPFRNQSIVEPDTEPDNDGHEDNDDDYDWDSGNVSISDVKKVFGDDKSQALEQSSRGGLEAASSTSVSRPNKRRRREDFQSGPVISTTLIRSEPIGRARTVPTGNIFVSELQRLHQSFNDTMSVQDLLQAQRLIHNFGTTISQALEKQIGGSAMDVQD